MLPTQSQRSGWIDIAKGLGVFFIVVLHSGFLPNREQYYPLITPWCIAVFGVIRGVIMEAQGYNHFSQSWKRHVFSLGIQYGFYGLVSYVLWLVLKPYAPHTVLDRSAYEQLMYFFLGKGTVFNGSLWFLPPFILAILGASLSKYIVRINAAALMALSCLCFWLPTVLNPEGKQLAYSVDIAVSLYGCILAGVAFAKAIRVQKSLYFIILFLLIFVWSSFENGVVSMFSRVYHNIGLFWLSAISGSFVICYIAQIVSRYSTPVRVFFLQTGKNSMVLYCLHWPVMQWVTYMLSLMGVLSYLGVEPSYTSTTYLVPATTQLLVIKSAMFFLYCAASYLIYAVVQKLFASRLTP